MSSLRIPSARGKELSRTAGLRDYDPADGVGILTITVDGEATDYTVERIGSDWGDGFRLTKHVGHPQAEASIYDVHLSDEGHTCDCPAGCYGRVDRCRHVAALVALRDAGQI